ncbi:MAG TPA: beta-propeller fold lactonase family protein [Terriglobales bacterium]|nr:beta-propeller fold lactonase family protein [Terriglobales bacterium]
MLTKRLRLLLVGLLISGILAWNGCFNSSSSSLAANTSLMWVATQGDQMVRSFTISQENGQIYPIGNNGNPVATGIGPMQMVATADGKTIFMANAGGTVTAYTIGGDGSLTAAGNPVSAGQRPVALALDPAGKFLFVANQGTASDVTSGTISVFSVSGSSLNEVPGSPFSTEISGDVTGSGPSAVAVSPVGNYVYVANQFNNTVLSFSFDSSGSLALVGSYSAGVAPASLAFSRCAGITATTAAGTCPVADGDNLFVANSGSNTVSIFSACIQVSAICNVPSGSLTQIVTGSLIPAGTAPAGIVVNPGWNYVYVVNQGSSDVSEYSYNPASGTLTSIGTGSCGNLAFAGSITSNVINTTSTFNWVVVTNNGAASLSVFRVAAADGKLNALSSGQYSVEGQPSAVLLR